MQHAAPIPNLSHLSIPVNTRLIRTTLGSRPFPPAVTFTHLLHPGSANTPEITSKYRKHTRSPVRPDCPQTHYGRHQHHKLTSRIPDSRLVSSRLHSRRCNRSGRPGPADPRHAADVRENQSAHILVSIRLWFERCSAQNDIGDVSLSLARTTMPLHRLRRSLRQRSAEDDEQDRVCCGIGLEWPEPI